ncbi:MAG: DUF5916 domain-containing protein, partial [Chitinophagaceae bacterium]
AVKVSQAPKIDGVLDDGVWANAPVLGDFIQNSPTFGLPCSQKTEVRIVYDNTAIYVGAYLYDDPALIRKQFTARDGEQQTDVDYFSIFFDTYNDKQNGFQFLVTTANVQTDARLTPSFTGDFGSYGDKTWDAVWESKVSMQPDGWTVEMRIPYISLRFAKKDVQDWGLQLLRFMRRNNESNFWSPVNPKVNGFVNQFGAFTNLQNIVPPLRLSFSPYVTTGYRTTPVGNTYLNEWLRNGGMDVKYGINESFTLDATLIPDFGQVISDNVVNNLTPYEVQFQENRQFFTEGTEIFNKAKLFYSRRVGAMPGGYYDVLGIADADPNIEIVKNPSRTQLYNAIKFSGRTKKKLGIGIFNAVTAPIHAIIRDRTTNEETKIETESLANYSIIVLDQAFKGRSSLTFTNTNVMRNGDARDANVTALDVALYDKKNMYSFQGTARYSKIWGTDPYDGYNTTVKYGKVSGNWQYYVQGNVESKNYDPNDLGILLAANEISYRGNLSYRKFVPTKNFINYSYSIAPRLQYLYKPYAYSKFDVTATAFWIFRNFWDITLTSNVIPGWERNYFELRTDGRPLSYPANYIFQVEGSTDSRKRVFVRFGSTYALAPKYNNVYTGISLGMRYRFSDKFSLDLQTDSHFEENQLGYAFRREVNGEPIVGFRDNRDFTSVLSGIYNFAYRLNLTLRARHYWNRVNYISFHNVDDKGYLLSRLFIPGQDENFNVFNVDAFLTWDFRLGSRLILGYKNWLGEEEMVNIGTGRNTYLKNLGNTFDLRHGNEFTVRFIYFLDYNQLRKKR